MKKLIIISLLLFSIRLFGQMDEIEYKETRTSVRGIVEISNDVVYDLTSVDSTIIKLIASWSSATENHVDSLTFNSTGDVINSIDGVTVTLDGGTNVTIGNAIRFGNALTGTVYTILDATGTVLILDQTCTASEMDEFFIGCIGLVNDVSGNNNHAIQTTGSKQPKVLWLGTDTVTLYYNSSILTFTEITNDTAAYVFMIRPYDNSENPHILGNTAASLNYIRINSNDDLEIEGNTGGDIISYASTNFTDGIRYCLVLNSRGLGVYALYINGELFDTQTLSTGVLKVSMIGDVSTQIRTFIGEIDDIKIYERNLSPTEIQSMYLNSRFNE